MVTNFVLGVSTGHDVTSRLNLLYTALSLSLSASPSNLYIKYPPHSLPASIFFSVQRHDSHVSSTHPVSSLYLHLTSSSSLTPWPQQPLLRFLSPTSKHSSILVFLFPLSFFSPWFTTFNPKISVVPVHHVRSNPWPPPPPNDKVEEGRGGRVCGGGAEKDMEALNEEELVRMEEKRRRRK